MKYHDSHVTPVIWKFDNCQSRWKYHLNWLSNFEMVSHKIAFWWEISEMICIMKNCTQECNGHIIYGISCSRTQDSMLMKNIWNCKYNEEFLLELIPMAMYSFMVAEHETWVPLGFKTWVFIPGTSAGLIPTSPWGSLQMSSNKTTIDPI